MEAQAQYLMWMKRQRDQILKSFSDSSSPSSWEEKAFAEDAARSIGGCIWPPRSYSCGFCRRDFKSAQALGGHMNVHRRDRARLKNSLKLSINPKCPSSDHSSPSKNNVVVVVPSPSSSSPLSNSMVSATSSSSSPFVQAKDIVKDYVETNLSVGLKPNNYCDEATSCKRTKTSSAAAVSTTLSFLISNEKFSLQKENLDLELRLGDPPKVL